MRDILYQKIYGLLGADAPVGEPRERANYLGLFAGAYRAGISLAQKTVRILGEGDAAIRAQSLAKELGAREIRMSPRASDGSIPGDPGDAEVEYLIDTTCREETGDCPSPSLTGFPALEGVVDLTVSPLRTRLLLAAEEADLLSCGGLYIAVAAAAIQWGEQRGTPVEQSEIDRVYRTILTGCANLAVTGLRGDGVEPVAKALSRLSRRPLVLVANQAEQIAGMAHMEGKLLLMEEGIAGKPEALYPAVRNSRVVFLTPPLDELKEEGDARHEQYWTVLQVYTAFCDRTFEYRGDPIATARAIWEDFRREPYLKRN